VSTPITCAVIVTYADRLELLTRVIRAAMACAVAKVVVVDNASSARTREGLFSLRDEYPDALHVLTLLDNTGSAGGFKAGMQYAAELPGIEFLWLLDDDNVPCPDALERLFDAYRLLGSNPDRVLLSLRRTAAQGAPARDARSLRAPRPNSFAGFHWRDVPAKLWRRMCGPRTAEDAPLRAVHMAPYGGLWFHRRWLGRIGLPDERFYLYGDDHEFSLRFAAAGGRLYLCEPSVVIDVDTSWHHRPTRSHPLVASESDERRLYYTLRNRVFLERRDVTTGWAYRCNRTLYLVYLFALALLRGQAPRALLRRGRLIGAALAAGDEGRLGRATFAAREHLTGAA
jgi:GT2 family glycosyltransferase